jgi:hypothetical protein
MATDKEVRAWANETGWTGSDGEPVSARGGVGREAHAAYDDANPGDGADYPEGMSAADFELADAVMPDDPEMQETSPKGPSSPSIRSTLRRRKRHGSPPGKNGTAGKTKPPPRVSTAELIGSAFRMGAKVATPIPPMYRTLRLQSIIAGPMLEGATAGTAIDRALQPLARLAATGDTAAALLAPNLAIAAMTFHGAQAAKAGTPPNPIVMQGCVEMMRYGLMAMMRVGGDAFAQQLAKEQDEEDRYGGSVDALIAYIMAPPAEDASAEEAAAARAAYMMAGMTEPEPEPAAM